MPPQPTPGVSGGIVATNLTVNGTTTLSGGLTLNTMTLNPSLSMGSSINYQIYGHVNASGATATSGINAFNIFNADSDTVDATTAGGLYNIYAGNNFGGLAVKGNRTGVFAFQNLTAGTGNLAGANAFYTALGAEGRASANDGGTGGTAAGSIFAANFIARLTTAATFFKTLQGMEVDVAAEGSSSVNYKGGLSIIQLSTDANSGALTDSALLFATQTSGTPPRWKLGIAFGALSGWWPIKATGTLIGTEAAFAGGPAYNAASGVDFSAVTFSGNAFRSTGFSVDGSGNVTGLLFTSTGGVTAATFVQSATATIGLASNNSSIYSTTNNAGAFPPSGTTSFAISDHFASAREVDFWNADTLAGTSFNFYQKTGASAATLTASISSAGLLTTASATLHATSTALTNNAAAQTATLTNGPTAGNPTKWIPINDNGTIRNIPAW